MSTPQESSRARLLRMPMVAALTVLGPAAIDLFVSGFLSGGAARLIGGGDVPLPLVWGVVVLTYLPLLVRRERPLTVLGWVVGSGLLLALLVHPFQPFFAALLAFSTVARQLDRSPALGGFAMVLALLGADTYVAARLGGGVDALELALIFAGWLLLASIVWVLGRHEHRIVARNRAREAALTTQAQQAAHEERQHIAREMHDVLTHSVSAMILQAGGAQAVARRAEADSPGSAELQRVQTALAAIEQTGAQAMREMHRLLAMRGPGDGEDEDGWDEHPGLAQIDRLVGITRDSGMQVQVHRSGTARHAELVPDVDIAAYRVVQEALTNAMKHAGTGAQVDVFETWHEDPQEPTVQLQVRCSDGTGGRTAASGSGRGLYGLRERVTSVGGEFDAGPAESVFVTSATLPVGSSPQQQPADGG